MRYHFEDYVLDTDRRELRRGSRVVHVAAQVFDLLDYLLRNRERVVSKDDLIAAVWDSRIVSDSALTTRLNVARRALGDSGDQQRLIKTLPRKGFRFVGAVREEQVQASAPADDVSLGQPQPSLGLADKPSIAVLPFATLPGDHNPEQFSDWIANDLLTEFSKLRWLLVMARNSSFAYRDKTVDVRQIRRELGVRYLLQGSVRRARGRVRVTGQLIDAMTGVHIWSEHYDRRWSDVFAVHDETIQAIAAAVASAIVHAERQRALRNSPEKLGAWDAYQLGMWHMSKCNGADNKVARGFFQRAIELDANFGRGYAALAFAYLTASSIFSEMSIAQGCEFSEPLVRKAIALDENDAEFRARLALTTFLKGDIEGAIHEAELILSVDGSNADALGVKGAALVYSGRPQEGRASIRRYLSLSPHDIARPVRLTQVAASLYLDSGYQEAALAAKQVVRQYPEIPIAYRWLAASLGQLGRVAQAQEALQTLLEKSPSSSEMYLRQRPPQYSGSEYKHMLKGLRKAGWKD